MKRSELVVEVGDTVVILVEGEREEYTVTRVEVDEHSDGTTIQACWWFFPNGHSNVPDFGIGPIVEVNGAVIEED